MATIKHDDARGTTWVKWRAGGRAGRDCSATFDTKGGSKGPNGWHAFAAQLAAEGHPEIPSGWVKQGRRWVRSATVKGTTETLGSYGLSWIREHKRGNELHKLQAASSWTNHVVPVLGMVWLDELTVTDVERWQRGLESKLSPGTIRNVRGLLRMVVRAAVREGMADVDVVSLVERSPGGRKYQSAPIPLDELPLYLRAAHAAGAEELTLTPQNGVIRDGSFGDLVEIMLLTSARIGELAALTTDSLLPATKTRPARLRISASVKPRVVDGKRTGRELGSTKTAAGTRTLELSERAAAILRRRAAASKLRGELYLFPAVTGGPLSNGTVRNRWLRMLAIAAELGAEVPPSRISEAGRERLGVTPHGLRRTHISYRLSLGHDVATVQHDAGHAHASTTLDIYTECVTSNEAKAAQAAQLGAVLEAASASR
jgi:integrase